MKSILDQFAADAINAPENVTGGKGGRTHRRTRTGKGSSSLSGGNTRQRTRRHHTRNDG